MTGAPYKAAVIANGPVGYWRLDDATGPAASNQIGGGGAGVYAGLFGLGQAGPFNDATCMFTPPSGGYVQLPINTPAVLIPSCLELVCKWTPGQTSYAAVRQTGGTAATAQQELSAQTIAFEAGVFNAAVDQNVFGFAPYGNGNWHHVVVNYDTGTCVLFIDGVQDVSLSGLLAPNVLANPFWTIGGWGFRAASAVTRTNGLWAEVALYGHVLTAAQVATHFAALAANAQSAVGGPPSGAVVTAGLDAILAAVRKLFVNQP